MSSHHNQGMNMKLLAIALLLQSLSVGANAATYVIKSDNRLENRFVKITDTEKTVSFEFCDRRSKRCDDIGPRSAYSKAAIKSKRSRELLRMTAVGAADLGIAVLALSSGAAIAGAAVKGMAGTLGFAAVMPGIAAHGVAQGGLLTLSQIAVWSSTTMNPLTYKQSADTARDAIGQKNMSKHDIVKFKQNLEDILYSIN